MLTPRSKALQSTPDSPINWCNQANIHFNHCSLGGPNAFYLQIHYGWLFLPWHRGYLYFYETVLGTLIGDSSFALPYWDWTGTPVVPDVFFDTSSVLYDQTRAIVAGQSAADDSEVFQYIQASNITFLQNLPNYSPPDNNPFAPSFGAPPTTTRRTRGSRAISRVVRTMQSTAGSAATWEASTRPRATSSSSATTPTSTDSGGSGSRAPAI